MGGKSHFEEITLKLDHAATSQKRAELIPGSGIVIRRFELKRL